MAHHFLFYLFLGIVRMSKKQYLCSRFWNIVKITKQYIYENKKHFTIY